MLYADDTLLLHLGTNINDCVRNRQDMLDRIVSWSDLNKLNTNVKKTNVCLSKMVLKNVISNYICMVKVLTM